jgi:uncharacterized membrane protein
MTAAIHTIFTRRLAIGAALALGLACQAQAARYKVQLLDKGPYDSITVRDINNAGQMVGSARRALPVPPGQSGYQLAVLWNGTAITTLDSMGWESAALTINNHGAVGGYVSVATSETEPSKPLAATWSAAGQRSNIGPWGANSRVQAINDAGQMAGITSSTTAEFDPVALRWSNAAQASPDRLDITGSTAYAIDGTGRVGGRVRVSFAGYEATIWSGGERAALPGLSGKAWHVSAMNKAGVAVGYADQNISNGIVSRAVSWDASGALTVLQSPADQSSYAADVNNHGQVLGTINSRNIWGNTKTRAVIWSGSDVIDLSASLDFWYLISGWTVAEVVALNDAGQVAVHLRKGADGELRPAVLTPVPAAK